jgi:hypothetical protein
LQAAKTEDLVMVGTVTKIYPTAEPRSLRNWAVVVNVDRVVSGEFTGTSFTFAVHSPARAGLQVGRTYTIKATRTAAGYFVDEAQWRGGAIGVHSPIAAKKCLKYWPTVVTLTGTLRSQVFPGPPNYESIKRGDRKETATILTLVAHACTTDEDSQDFNDAETNIREVQLLVLNAAHWKIIRRLIGKRATVTGTLFHAHTGHHWTKVLIDVTTIRAGG